MRKKYLCTDSVTSLQANLGPLFPFLNCQSAEYVTCHLCKLQKFPYKIFYIISVNRKIKGFNLLSRRQCQHLKLVNCILKKIKPLFSCSLEGEGETRARRRVRRMCSAEQKDPYAGIYHKSSLLFFKQNIKLPINIPVAGAWSIFPSSPIECCSSNFTHKNIIIGKCKISYSFKGSNSESEKTI